MCVSIAYCYSPTIWLEGSDGGSQLIMTILWIGEGARTYTHLIYTYGDLPPLDWLWSPTLARNSKVVLKCKSSPNLVLPLVWPSKSQYGSSGAGMLGESRFHKCILFGP